MSVMLCIVLNLRQNICTAKVSSSLFDCLVAQSVRVRELGQPIHPSMSKQTAPMYTTINTLLEGLVPDLQSLNVNRYHPNISGGLQEFMEAVLFQHYLETQTLLSHEDASRRLPQGIRLTQEDYLLGLFDTTGELMRFAITYIATNGRLPASGTAEDIGSSILGDMQALRTGLEALDTRGIRSLKDFDSKMKVTRASVEKVENGVYSMLVRGKERPKGWRPDTGPERRDAEEVESY